MSLHSTGEYVGATIRAIQYVKRYRKFFDVPGFSFNHCPELGWLRTELATPFDEWTKRRGLGALATLWEPALINMGYGPYCDVAALYYLQYMLSIPRTTVYSALSRRLRKGGLGFRSFSRGSQSLFEAVAKDHCVHTEASVTRIAREGNSWRLFSLGERELGSFDAVLLAIPIEKAFELLDSKECETGPDCAISSVQQEAARELRYSDYYSTLAEVDGLPGDVSGYFSFRSQHLGLPGGHGALHPSIDSPLWVFYHYGQAQHPGNSDAAAQKLRTDLDKAGVNLTNVVMTRGWPNYFARVSQSAIASGFYDRIDAIQGRKGIFFLGASVGFEVLEHVIAYSYWLIDKHFPVAPAGQACG